MSAPATVPKRVYSDDQHAVDEFFAAITPDERERLLEFFREWMYRKLDLNGRLTGGGAW